MSYLHADLLFSTLMAFSAIKHGPAVIPEWISMKINDEELLCEARSILSAETETSKLSDLELICECECISAGDIREYLKGKNNNLNLEDIKKELKLGSGCSTCVKSFDAWKDRI